MIISKFLYKDIYVSNKLMRVIKLRIAALAGLAQWRDPWTED